MLQESQRVLVRWERWAAGEQREHAGHVIEIRGEFRTGRIHRGEFVQTHVRVQYEAGGKLLWHKISEVSPLDEDAIAPRPFIDEEDEDEDAFAADAWQLLPLRC